MKSKKTEQPQSDPMQVEKEVTKSVQDGVEKQVSKEVVPSKTCILKRTKEPAHRPRHSPKPPVIEEVHVEPFFSPKVGFISKGIKKIHKPQLNRGGVRIHDVLVPVSPTSKKRKAHEVVKKIKKKRQLADPLDDVVVELILIVDSKGHLFFMKLDLDLRHLKGTLHSLILSSTIETTLTDTSTSLPYFSSPIPSTLPYSTISLTFSNIMHEPITTLFSLKSTEGEKTAL
ncbi:unnamed protein product [Lactuca virosa]|uniref:Uncharacterized protein n=1 Tax=Lactuca virosa TaxID=75947 RepID=A0AAU9MNL4_9ASTR|nr:unnamed protein product [Lactuca virosa]